MNKKFIIIPALVIAIGGGVAFAQTDVFEAAVSNPTISAKQAKDIALKQVDGKIVSFEYDADGLKPHYEIEIIKDNEKVEVKIDAKSGKAKITEREMVQNFTEQTIPETKASEQAGATQKTTPQTTISQEEAIKIAQSKAAGKVISIELDTEDNNLVYEIEIRNGKMEYDFEIDATTGAILKYEEDLED